MRTPRIKIAEATDFSPEVAAKLGEFFTVDISPCSAGELQSILRDFDVFWFRLGFRITAKDIPSVPACKVIATPVTGTDHIDHAACARAGIKVISLKGEFEFLKTIRATAEHTILLTLMILRHPVEAVHSVNSGVWNRDLFRGNEIYGKTVGIVGLGRLGAIVASYFQSMGAVVIGFDKEKKVLPGLKQVKTLEEIAVHADIVSVHLSLEDSTLNIIDKSFFDKIKPGSYFVNTSRGGVVEETALLEALGTGRLKAAALDVLQEEHRATGENPLIAYARAHHNLIITPHIGGNTRESFLKTENFIADKIISFFKP